MPATQHTNAISIYGPLGNPKTFTKDMATKAFADGKEFMVWKGYTAKAKHPQFIFSLTPLTEDKLIGYPNKLPNVTSLSDITETTGRFEPRTVDPDKPVATPGAPVKKRGPKMTKAERVQKAKDSADKFVAENGFGRSQVIEMSNESFNAKMFPRLFSAYHDLKVNKARLAHLLSTEKPVGESAEKALIKQFKVALSEEFIDMVYTQIMLNTAAINLPTFKNNGVVVKKYFADTTAHENADGYDEPFLKLNMVRVHRESAEGIMTSDIHIVGEANFQKMREKYRVRGIAENGLIRGADGVWDRNPNHKELDKDVVAETDTTAKDNAKSKNVIKKAKIAVANDGLRKYNAWRKSHIWEVAVIDAEEELKDAKDMLVENQELKIEDPVAYTKKIEEDIKNKAFIPTKEKIKELEEKVLRAKLDYELHELGRATDIIEVNMKKRLAEEKKKASK
jgi:hypothetical protein